MPISHAVLPLSALVTAVLLALAPASFSASPLTTAFDIPDGFVATSPERARGGGEAGREVLTIRPEPGPFAGFNSLTLRIVDEDIADPAAWLRRRMRFDVVSGDDLAALFDSPDSPFGAPAFDGLREALPGVAAGLDRLARAPLDDCTGPERVRTEAGEGLELRCEHAIGPFRRLAALRLQRVLGVWYGIDIVAVNEQRFRHLLAIANSFRPDRRHP